VNQPYFIGYAPRWFTLDKLYLVVGLPDALMGLRVGGQITGPSQSQPSNPRSYFKAKFASRYEGMHLLDPSLTGLDDQNFLLRSVEVASAAIKPRRSLWTGPIANSGVLVLRLRSERPRRFILLGDQRHEDVLSVLASATIAVDPSLR